MGVTVSGAPTLLTLNPPVAHVSQHIITALVHDYEGNLFLTPHR